MKMQSVKNLTPNSAHHSIWSLHLFITFIFCFLLLCTGKSEIHNHRPFFTTLSLKDGLPSNQIIYLFNDSKGLIWIGTEQGLASYNGTNVTKYENSKLNQSLITCIKEDSNGRIWATSAAGNVFIIDNEHVIEHPQNDKIKTARTSVLIQDFAIKSDYSISFRVRNGFCVATMDSVYMIHETQAEKILVQQFNTTLLADVNNKNLTSNLPITFHLSDTSFTYPNIIPALFGLRTYSIATDSSFAIAFLQEVLVYENGKINHIKIPSRATNSLTFTKDGSLWIATETKGAFQIKHGKITSNVFPNEKIHTICQDFEGGLWFGMPSSGVRYVPSLFVDLITDSSPARNVIHLFSDNNLKLNWITPKGDLNSLDGVRASTIPYDEIATFQKGTLYNKESFCFSITTPSITPRIICIDRSNFSPTSHKIKDIQHTQRIIKESKGDTLVIAYNQISNLKSVQKFISPNTSNGATFRDLVEFNDRIWIASTNGLYQFKYNPNSETLIEKETILGEGKSWQRLINLKRFLFAITREGNLYQVDVKNNSLNLINSSTGRAVTALKTVNNNAYIAFSDGIAQLTVDSLSREKATSSFNYLPIDINQFQSTIFDLEPINQFLYLACADGIIRIDLKNIQNFTHSGKLQINQIFSNISNANNSLDTTHFYSNQNINVRITAAQFRQSQNYSFEYRLLPSDSIWYKSNQRELNFYQLPASDYKLEVRLLSGVKDSIEFTVSDHWYQEVWLIVSVVIIATTLSLLPIYYKIRLNIIADNIEREKNNLRFSNLNIQLKPHFIFNALNSIQAYMLEQNTAKAVSYLSKFATHIRATLEQSREDLIPLAVSLKSLENYLTLEQMRKNDGFEFEINVEPKINTQKLLVPPLLIQPYVENAIIHGFSEIENGGKINIIVSQSDERTISVLVQDNGCGLLESETNNLYAEEKNSGLGTKINFERIDTLNSLYGRKFSVHIENAKHGTGIWVEIKIPLNLNEK